MPRITSLCLATLLLSCAQRNPEFDVLIQGATLVDPATEELRQADLAVRGERIAAIGDLTGRTAKVIVLGTRLHLAPGFIDTHSHTAGALASADRSAAPALLYQGVTTVVVNPDGRSPLDLEQQRQELRAHGLGVNVALLIGHGSIREKVLGMEDRVPTAEELETMKGLVEQGMEAGAVGLSSGPFYAPGSFAETAELVALAAIAARYNGVYQSHIRDESNYSIGLEAAVEEVITVAEQAEVTGVVTHIKALGPPVWGRSQEVVAAIEKARKRGVSVFADQYPYPASATGLAAALVPRWAQAGGHEAFLERLEDDSGKARIVAAMAENLARRGGAERIQFQQAGTHEDLEGKTLAAVAEKNGLEAIDQALLLLRDGEVQIISFNMSDNDVERFMAQPWTMTASDGAYPSWGEGMPHPRSFGTFPRRLRRYSLDKEVLPLARTVRSMTTLPAEVYGLSGRGVLEVGAFADLVLFDSQQIEDKATFEEPYQLADGIRLVLVNGELAHSHGGGMPRVNEAEPSPTLAGRILTRAPAGN